MNSIVHDLTSALSELKSEFPTDPEAFHLGVSIVVSSIFTAHGFEMIIVGGQASAYWLHRAFSTDSDFVCARFEEVREILLSAGFTLADNSLYRLHHEQTDALIELVGETAEIAGHAVTEFVSIERSSIENPTTQKLMAGTAVVLDPAELFINYLDASCEDSIWFDTETNGKLAYDRTKALFNLYGTFITESVMSNSRWKPSETQIVLLKHEFAALYTALYEKGE